MSYYQRDPAPLSRAQETLKWWSVGQRGGLTLLITALVLSGPALLLASHLVPADEHQTWLTEPRLGPWTWFFWPLLLLLPYAAVQHRRALWKHWVYVYDYAGSAVNEQFVANIEQLKKLPPTEEQHRPLWLDSVKALEDRDLEHLQTLHQLLRQLNTAHSRLLAAQREANRSRFVVQDTRNRIEQIDLETEALQKELSS